MIKLILFILFAPIIIYVWLAIGATILTIISLIPVWLLAYVMFACLGWIGFHLTYKP